MTFELAAGDIDKAEPSTDVGPVSRFIPTLRRKSELLAPTVSQLSLNRVWYVRTSRLRANVVQVNSGVLTRRLDGAIVALQSRRFSHREGQMDWVAEDSDAHGAIDRVYSTHYYDRVSGVKLEIVSIPSFVLELLPPEASKSQNATSRSVEQFIEVSSELLGANAQFFQIVEDPRRGYAQAPPVASTYIESPQRPEKRRYVFWLEEMGFRVESLSERVAFDLMLGRQEHQAFRTQLQAPTIPIESSPPVMQAAVEIVQQAFFGVFNSGTGGLIVTAVGTAVGFFAKKAGRAMADEAAAIARRGARSLTSAGRIQNDNELLILQKENLELRRKNIELRAKMDRDATNVEQPADKEAPRAKRTRAVQRGQTTEPESGSET